MDVKKLSLFFGIFLVFVGSVSATTSIYEYKMDYVCSQSSSDTHQVHVPEGGGIIVANVRTSHGETHLFSSPSMTFSNVEYANPNGTLATTVAVSNYVPEGIYTVTVHSSVSYYIRWATYVIIGVPNSGYLIDHTQNYDIGTRNRYMNAGTVVTDKDGTLLLAIANTNGDETAHGSFDSTNGYIELWDSNTLNCNQGMTCQGTEPCQKMSAAYKIVNAGSYSQDTHVEQYGENGYWTDVVLAFAPSDGTPSSDTTAPSVAIISPTSSSTYTATSPTINLGGTASDNVGVTSVSWSNSRGGSGTASGTTSWNVNGITLQSGSNVLTVTARDAAGNTKTDTLTINFGSTTIYATSCSQSAVQSAIDSAHDGDVVNVPAGNCTWTGGVIITKGLTITGAGVGSSTISFGSNIDAFTFDPSVSAITNDEKLDISGFTFDMNSKKASVLVFDDTSMTTPMNNILFHDNKIQEIDNGAKVIQIYGMFFGVIYDNVFVGGGSGEILRIHGGTRNGVTGAGTYEYVAEDYGSSNGMYFEDNTISGNWEFLSYCENGGFPTWRYNDISLNGGSWPAWFDMHPATDGSVQSCGCFSVEVYGNDIVNNYGGDLGSIRGGQGIFAWNKLGGSHQDSEFHMYQQYSTTNYCSSATTNPRNKYPTNMYAVNNRNSFSVVDLVDSSSSTKFIEDVDYFNTVASGYNGSAGIGCGALANRPASASHLNTAYFATDLPCTAISPNNVGAHVSIPITGTLYYWDGSTWRVKWKPYTYPHPLRSGSTVLYGDLNNSCTVDILDVVLCVNVVLGTETNPAVVSRADVNGDGNVDILDVMKIVNAILPK